MIVLITGSVNAQSVQQDFNLKGTLDKDNVRLYLFYTNSQGQRVIDSTEVNNHQFSFTGTIGGPTMATIAKSKRASMEDPNTVFFYLEPGQITITLKENQFKTAIVIGSKTQQEYRFLEDQRNELRARFQNIFDTLTEVNKRSNVEFQKMKNWVLVPYEKEMHQILTNFLAKHPESYVAPMALMSLRSEMPTDTLALYFNRFPKAVQNTEYGKMISQELERRKLGVPGTEAAGFTKTDIKGKQLSLTDFRGKYVLLDFWASWCVPCRAGNPHLLKLYSKYKDKGLEIIGISDDDSKPQAWKTAVEKDGIGVWRHVLRGFDMDKLMKGEENPNDISKKYGIASLPTKILIDRNGMIIGRYGENGGDDKALDEKLASVFE